MTAPEPEAQHVVPFADYEALQADYEALLEAELYPGRAQVRVSTGERSIVFDPAHPNDGPRVTHWELEHMAALCRIAATHFSEWAARVKAADYPPVDDGGAVRDELLELYRRLER